MILVFLMQMRVNLLFQTALTLKISLTVPAEQLTLESANSPFTPSGRLAEHAINDSKMIFAPGELSNPAIPEGFGKYTTQTFQSFNGDF